MEKVQTMSEKTKKIEIDPWLPLYMGSEGFQILLYM